MASLKARLSQRGFLKVCGVALAAAGAGQLVIPPKTAFAAVYNEDVTINDPYKLGVGLPTGTTPAARVHVKGTGHTAIVRIESDTASYPYLQFYQGANWFQFYHRNDNPYPRLIGEYNGVDMLALTSDKRLGIGTLLPLTRLHVGSNLHTQQYGAALLDGALALMWGNVPQSQNPPNAVAYIWHEATGGPVSGSIRFKFANGKTPLVVHSIGNDGNGAVGIGTDSPAQRLTIEGDNSSYGVDDDRGQLVIRGTASNPADTSKKNYQRLVLGYNTASNWAWIQAGRHGSDWDHLVLCPSGAYVGIGLIGPEERLHVGGNARVDGEIRAGASAKLVANSGGCAYA